MDYEKMKTPEAKLGRKPLTIHDLLGSGLHRYTKVNKMDVMAFDYPEINEQKCLQCGHCYLACADAGYQAIEFAGHNTFPKVVQENCTGCGLCVSVCTAEDAIHMVPRTLPYEINRGTIPGPNFPKEALLVRQPRGQKQ